MKVSRRIPTAALAVAALGAAIGCDRHHPELAAPSLEAITVRTALVERITASQPIEVRGTVQPGRQAFVSSRVMGPVTAIWVEAGSRVSQGQRLLQIDPAASDGQLAQATGALAQARAALSLAERNYRRFEALHADTAASDLELDMARMDFERAQGAVAQAEGAVQGAATVAGESVVRAPFAGRVVDTLVDLGDLAAPGRPLVQVESTADGRSTWWCGGRTPAARPSDPGDVDAPRARRSRRSRWCIGGPATTALRSRSASPAPCSRPAVVAPDPGDESGWSLRHLRQGSLELGGSRRGRVGRTRA
jgi:multidrug efflux pump subunit AcrA (membrane-fusion protein)